MQNIQQRSCPPTLRAHTRCIIGTHLREIWRRQPMEPVPLMLMLCAVVIYGRGLRHKLFGKSGFFFILWYSFVWLLFAIVRLRRPFRRLSRVGANGFGVKPPRLSGDAKVSHSDFSVWQMEMTHSADMEKARYIEGRLHATTHRVVGVGAQSYTKSLLLSSPSLIAAFKTHMRRRV